MTGDVCTIYQGITWKNEFQGIKIIAFRRIVTKITIAKLKKARYPSNTS